MNQNPEIGSPYWIEDSDNGETGNRKLPPGEDARANVKLIIGAAQGLGIRVPTPAIFLAGQVFYCKDEVEEVRLALAVPAQEGAGIAETWEDLGDREAWNVWTTPTAPQIEASINYSDGQLLPPDAANRRHLSALLIPAAADLKSSNLLLMWDLRGISGKPKPLKQPLPKHLPQPTFIEARTVSHAISEAPNEENWGDVDGEFALLHSPRIDGKKPPLETRFEPTPELWEWRGIGSPTKEAVREALKKLNFETNMTFQVTLACLLQTEHARWTGSLDDLIKLIGRNTDARRNSETRQELRREVWGNLLALASMPVIGARNGVWREPGPQNEKRAIIPKEALISRDPLLIITGTKGTNNINEPPKEVSITAGEWLMPWIGNQEILSFLGDVLKFAQIPRGKVSGAWAACIGLALQQQWREEATKAGKNLVSRGKTEGTKIEVLKFRPFTRRELLTELFSCDDENSPDTILNDPEGRRARAQKYWQVAIDELKRLGVINHYRETTRLEEMNTNDLNTAWLDQPLDIRPSDAILKDVLEIHNSAQKAIKRGRRSGTKAPNRGK